MKAIDKANKRNKKYKYLLLLKMGYNKELVRGFYDKGIYKKSYSLCRYYR